MAQEALAKARKQTDTEKRVMGSFSDWVFGLCSISDGGLCEAGPTQTLGIGRVMQGLKDGG